MDINFKDADDLLRNETFLAWYFKSNDEHVQAWETFLKENPHKSEIIEEASRRLELVRQKEIPAPPGEVQSVATPLTKEIKSQKGENISVDRNTRRMMAAALIVWVLLVILEYRNNYATPGFQTGYGEIKQQELPDGSSVTLNANTSVKISRNWMDDKDREVWVNGEAFFEVTNKPQKQRFVLHTAGFDVILTGTRLNVTNKGEKTSVFLEEGSLLIRPNNFYNYKEIQMSPGDFVQFSNELIEKKTVNDDRLKVWRERKIVFENSTPEEVAAFVKEYYGVKVKITPTSTSPQKITGTFPNDNLDAFLRTMETTLHFRIDR